MPNPPLPVVCALIERRGRLLVAQRPDGGHLGGKWEFPGGKVERGETPAQALVREIREELGSTIRLQEALPRQAHTYDHAKIVLLPFRARLAPDSPDPVAREHRSLRWVRPSDLEMLNLAAADRPVVTAYRKHLSHHA